MYASLVGKGLTRSLCKPVHTCSRAGPWNKTFLQLLPSFAYSYPASVPTLLKMGRYYNATMCHYWDMSLK